MRQCIEIDWDRENTNADEMVMLIDLLNGLGSNFNWRFFDKLEKND